MASSEAMGFFCASYKPGTGLGIHARSRALHELGHGYLSLYAAPAASPSAREVPQRHRRDVTPLPHRRDLEVKMKLPNSFINVIKKHNIKEEDIIFTAAADFDMEYRFADSILALTKTKLIFAAYPYREKVEYRFGGYAGWQVKEDAVLLDEPALQIFELSQIEKLEVIS